MPWPAGKTACARLAASYASTHNIGLPGSDRAWPSLSAAACNASLTTRFVSSARAARSRATHDQPPPTSVAIKRTATASPIASTRRFRSSIARASARAFATSAILSRS